MYINSKMVKQLKKRFSEEEMKKYENGNNNVKLDLLVSKMTEEEKVIANKSKPCGFIQMLFPIIISVALIGLLVLGFII